MKKAQIQSQAFMYIFSIIIIGLIFLFGFYWIRDLGDRGEEIEKIKLKTDLEREFRNIRSKYGSWQIISFAAPSSVNRVCFLQLPYAMDRNSLPGLCNTAHEDYDLLMCDIWETQAQDEWKETAQNVLFDPLEGEINVGRIEFSNYHNTYTGPQTGEKGYRCFPVRGGQIKLKLFGFGDYVRIESAEGDSP